jgi:PKD repeat protein
MRLFLCSLFAFVLVVQSLGQCATCTPDPDCVSEVAFPAICPLILPDATAGEDYESVLTFFLPATIVDPGTEIEASLDEVIITNVAGLPFGMDYLTNSPDNTYHPGEGEVQGCATICGIPLLAGDYLVTIYVHVTVTAFGFEQELDESFQLPLTVVPGEGGNASFTVDNLAACGSLEVTCVATIDGAPGVTSYSWDFGNGSTSNEATPPVQTYSEPGDYTISLVTEIQDYTLQSVSAFSLADGWGGDIEDGFGLLDPDPYFVITDGDGNNIYTAPYITDVNSATWNNIGLVLNNPPYSITFWDSDDLFTDDDYLGTTTFDLATGTAVLSAEGTSGALAITLETSSLFEETEGVIVFANPEPVLIFNGETQALEVAQPELETYTWFMNGDTIAGELSATLPLPGPGVFSCAVTNEFGCGASTGEFVYCPELTLVFNENTQVLSVGGGYSVYTWYFNGLQIEGESGSSLLADVLGNYSVSAETEFGCDESSNVYTVTVGIAETNLRDFTLFPNPASNVVHVEGAFLPTDRIEVLSFDGKWMPVEAQEFGAQRRSLDLSGISAGTYLLIINRLSRVEKHRLIITH